jgi:hypothetical protein
VYAIHIEVSSPGTGPALIAMEQLTAEASRVPGCVVEHVYQPTEPYRGRLGVLFVSAASADAAGRGVLAAVQTLLTEPHDKARAVFRQPLPGARAAMCHGVVSVPARIRK